MVTCPSSITNCVTCIQHYSDNSITCQTCISGYYATSNGVCQVCPLGCNTCSLSYSSVRCDSCVTNFQHTGWWYYKYKCECLSNQYVDAATPQCVNCPTGCSGCTSSSLCTSCFQGYYLSGSLCSACMQVCQTCDAGNTCSSCPNNLIISGTICDCPTAQPVLDPSTTTCIACTTFDANCQTCDYDPSGYNPSSPTLSSSYSLNLRILSHSFSRTHSQLALLTYCLWFTPLPFFVPKSAPYF